MDEISEYLSTANYPATPRDLIAAAVAANAPEALIARLEALDRDQYGDAESVSRDLVRRRAESNPALVAIAAEACEHCGFPRVPGEPHSCVEEKARFADSVNAVTDEFERIDERRHTDPHRGAADEGGERR